MKQTEEICEKIWEKIKTLIVDEYVEHEECGYNIGCILESFPMDEKIKDIISQALSSQLQAEKIETYKKGYIAGGLAQSKGEFLVEDKI